MHVHDPLASGQTLALGGLNMSGVADQPTPALEVVVVRLDRQLCHSKLASPTTNEMHIASLHRDRDVEF
jgi:predicted DNA-binding protein with PD1-like motif